MIIISLIVTFIAIGISIYAFHITSQVAGNNLLTIDSTLGYEYATTYRIWQMIAAIVVLIAILLWIITIAVKIRKHKRAKELMIEQKVEKSEMDKDKVRHCEKCGNKIEGNAMFCDICGEPVGNITKLPLVNEEHKKVQERVTEKINKKKQNNK